MVYIFPSLVLLIITSRYVFISWFNYLYKTKERSIL
nr:MAG TPA: hypothetical protein [Caudoviricetes sp.]